MKNALILMTLIIVACSKPAVIKPAPTSCPSGYSGDNCSVVIPTKFIGNWIGSVAGSIAVNGGNGSCSNSNIPINQAVNLQISSNGNNSVELYPIFGSSAFGQLINPNSFSVSYLLWDPSGCRIPIQNVSQSSPVGQGTINAKSDTIIINVNSAGYYGSTGMAYCTMTFTLIKQ